MSCTHRENFRGEALKAIGQLALVLPDDTVNRLDDICNVIKECLNSKKSVFLASQYFVGKRAILV